jgi:hypothetical protein
MKTAMRIYSAMAAVVVLAGVEFAQAAPPPNDNFTNRLVLTGTDVSFDGTLAEATLESGEIMPPPGLVSAAQTESVWWEWTAPASETVLIQVSNPSQPSGNDTLAVYSLSNISSGQFIVAMPLPTGLPELFFAFEAIAGTNYQIQLAGSDGTSFHFRLLATNSPCIIEQPRSQTITTGDSVLFTVLAASGSPKGYQWQFNATNLPGETFPILALDSPDASQAGPYQVIITNATGAVTSQVATLWMTTVDTVPGLRATSASTNNEFAFRMLGDVGRRYCILSSASWSGPWWNENSFPGPWGPSSVVIDWTGADRFALQQQTSPSKFWRASAYHATMRFVITTSRSSGLPASCMATKTTCRFPPLSRSRISCLISNSAMPAVSPLALWAGRTLCLNGCTRRPAIFQTMCWWNREASTGEKEAISSPQSVLQPLQARFLLIFQPD